MKTPKPTFTNGFGSFRYGVFIYVRPFCCMAHLLTRSGDSIAQHLKSNKRLHKTFGWILVETADFKNRAIMLQCSSLKSREQ